MQRDDDSIGIPEQLHQTANVFQVATAEALRLDNQHGLDPRRFHPPQYLLYAGAALNGFARHDFPVTVCFRNPPTIIRYVARHPVVQHLLMFGKHFLHGQRRIIGSGLPEIHYDVIDGHLGKHPHFD